MDRAGECGSGVVYAWGLEVRRRLCGRDVAGVVDGHPIWIAPRTVGLPLDPNDECPTFDRDGDKVDPSGRLRNALCPPGSEGVCSMKATPRPASKPQSAFNPTLQMGQVRIEIAVRQRVREW